ncbi:MAG: SGNH/GDSL hydrolase family protein [Burkholderiales bacterium]
MQQQSSASANIWEAAIVKFEETDRRSPPPKEAVVFVGSSSIALWNDLADAFPSTKVINRGFGGSEIADATHYIDRIVAPYQPKMVVLYAGDNDLDNGKAPQRVFEDFREFVNHIRRKLPGIRIAFISIKPSPARWHLIQHIRAANEMIRAYASQGADLIYLDIFTPMLAANDRPREELFAADKLHLSAEGYRLWTSVIAPRIAR